MIGLPELDFELTTLSNPSSFSTGIPTYREEEEDLSRCISGYAPAKGAKHAKAGVVAPSADVQTVSARLAADGPGWVVVAFAALGGERVVIVRELPPPAEIPPAVADLPRYTLPELERLALAGAVDGPPMFRALHELKRLLPAAGWKVASVTPSNPASGGGE